MAQLVNVLADKNAKTPTELTWYNGGKMVKTVLSDEMKTALNLVKINTKDELKSDLHPHLCSFQIMLKTREEILYAKAEVTKKLGLPGYLEPFANGKMVRNKLKKAKPRAIGILNHVWSLHELHFSCGEGKGLKMLESTVKKRIIKQKAKFLKNQVIGNCQKGIVDEFEKGNFDNPVIFGMTLPFIKPRTDHAFVLHPSVLMQLEPQEFGDANYSSDWVWTTSARHRFDIVHPALFTRSWEIQVHMLLQSNYEDLDVLSWVIGRQITPRQEWEN